jgi:hypothetical protein
VSTTYKPARRERFGVVSTFWHLKPSVKVQVQRRKAASMRKFPPVLLAPAVSVLVAIAIVAACDRDTDSTSSSPSDAPSATASIAKATQARASRARAETSGSTTTTESTPPSAATGSARPSGTESRTTLIPNDTDAVGGQRDQTQGGSTQDCRLDPDCPSSEHRTSDPCGAAIIVDTGGYLEGRRDAEQGLAYQIDNAPAPEAADNDDDDGTVGPETRYRAGYAQGWCDGGGTIPGAG